MHSRDRVAFGRGLRRLREQRGISLTQLARETKVPIELWDELERGDLVRWPTGLFARSFVRAYAQKVGAEPGDIVDEFCRLFPQGDRRAARHFREQAALIGHSSEWSDDLLKRLPHGDRRSRTTAEEERAARRRARIAAAVVDVTIVGGSAVVLGRIPRVGGWAALAIASVGYHVATFLLSQATPGGHLVSWWQRRVMPDFWVAFVRRYGWRRATE